jgi:cytochrome bd-type quinol oxidase subunit 2
LFEKLKNWFRARRGELKTIVSIVMGVLLVALLFPVAMDQIATTTHTGWNSAVWTVFSVLLPILCVIAIAMLFVYKATSRRGELKTIANLVIGLLLVALLFPVAMQQVASMNTTGWNPAVATVTTVLLPILAIIAIAMIFVYKATSRR